MRVAAIEQLEHCRLTALQHEPEHCAHALLREQGARAGHAELFQGQLLDPALGFFVTAVADERGEICAVHAVNRNSPAKSSAKGWTR